MTGLNRFSVVAALAVVAAAAPAWAQAITFTITGSTTDQVRGFTGTGTGTLTPGGAATLTLAGRDSGDNSCVDGLQIAIKLTAGTTDTLSVLFNVTQFSQANGATNVKGTLAVTGGTGAYAGKGGTGTMDLVATETSPTTSTFTGSGTVTLGGPLVPAVNIPPGGIVPVFGINEPVAPGSWVSVFGDNLANGTTEWKGDFPTALGNVTATVDGKAAFFWYVSAGQINMQVPDGVKNAVWTSC